uniref:Uncharacterized protein n=1 Tax=Tanacetum cinerariifolium TaxID=118510 RepID=A0A699I3C2_TANCI|nr:hypothetical protein [Tanacetum cinerariifolium]
MIETGTLCLETISFKYCLVKFSIESSSLIALPSPDYVPGPEHPPSPDYVPGLEHPHLPVYVPDPKYPEYLVPSGDEAPMKDQPLPDDASPTALSSGYVDDSDPKEDPKRIMLTILLMEGMVMMSTPMMTMMMLMTRMKRPLKMRMMTRRRSI